MFGYHGSAQGIHEMILYLLNLCFYNFYLATFICSLLLGYLLLQLYKLRLNRAVISGIPVVPADSLFGFSKAFIPNKTGSTHTDLLTIAERYGKLVQFSLFGDTVIMINDEKLAKDALLKVVGKGSILRGNPHFNHQNIFNLDTNDEWQRRRAAFRSAFSNSYLNTQKHIISELTKKLVTTLSEKAKAKELVEIDILFGQLTIDVICKIAFNLNIDALENSQIFQELHKAIRIRFKLTNLGRLPLIQLLIKLPFEPFKTYSQSIETIKNFCKFIWSHLKELESKNELDPNGLGKAIISFSKQPGVTEDDILSEINILFVAGHETTAHTLSWFIYCISKNGDVQYLCQQAVDSELVEAVGTLPIYVEAVLKESMRKFPVAVFGSFRRVNDEKGYNIVCNNFSDSASEVRYHLPKGCWILVNFYVLHNSKRIWGSNANEFLPERWMPNEYQPEERETNKELGESERNPLSSLAIYSGGGKTKNDLSFAPFSFGIRHCIGMNLALLEIKVTIKELLKNFTFYLADESLEDEIKVMESFLTLRPSKNLPVKVYSRKNLDKSDGFF